jgi:hypothetical protein
MGILVALRLWCGEAYSGFFTTESAESAEVGSRRGFRIRIRIRTLLLPVRLCDLCALCGESSVSG